MRKVLLIATSVVSTFWILTGCIGGASQVGGASAAQTCEATVGVRERMSEVTILLLSNPLGYEVYVDELETLSSDLGALNPRDRELDDAIKQLSQALRDLLDRLESSESTLGDLSDSLAKTQIASLEVANLCESSLNE